MELKPFDRDDWMAFAGAEEEPGRPPMIASATLKHAFGTSIEATVVVDLNGVEVHLFHDDAQAVYQIDSSWELGQIIAKGLVADDLTGSRLSELGFRRIL